MKLFKLKNFAMIGAMSIAGTGLIGIGAHAVFTTSTASSQTITAGTMGGVVLSSPDASNGCISVGVAVANPSTCHTLTLNPPAPVGSTFETPASTVTVTNNSNIPVTEASMQLTDSTNGTPGNYLQNQMDICIYSDGNTVATGPLTTGLGLTPSIGLNAITLAANNVGAASQDTYQVDFYAGQNSALCTTPWSSGPHTAYAWSGSGWPYPQTNPWVTPASLTNDAQGGVVGVTLSMAYTG